MLSVDETISKTVVQIFKRQGNMGHPVTPEECPLKDRVKDESPASCSTSGSLCKGAGGAGSSLCNKYRMKAPAETVGECHNFHLISMIYSIPVHNPFLLTVKYFLLLNAALHLYPQIENPTAERIQGTQQAPKSVF